MAILERLYLWYKKMSCEHQDLVFITREEIQLDNTIIHNHKWVCKNCGKIILTSHTHNKDIKK